MGETTGMTRAAGPAPQGPRKPLSAFLQFPILFLVFLFFAAGDLGSYVDFGSAKYESYRTTLLGIAGALTGTTRSTGAPGAVPLVIFALMYLPPLLVALRSRNWPALILGMAALHALGLALLARYGIFKDVEAEVNRAFTIGAVLSFLWLVLWGRIWSGAYGLLLIVSIPFLLAILPSGDGLILNRILPYLTLHAAFVILILLIRTVILIARDNAYVFRGLFGPGGGAMVGRTLIRWTPILVLALPYFLISCQVEHDLRIAAYQEPEMFDLVKADQPEDSTLTRPLAYILIEDRDLEADTLAAIRARYTQHFNAWTREVAGWRREVEQTDVEDFDKFVGQKFDQIVPGRLSMRPPEHEGIAAPATEFAVNEAQKEVNRAYMRNHQRMRDALIHQAELMEDELTEPKELAEKGLGRILRRGQAAIIEACEATVAAVQGAFLVTRIFNWLTWLLFVVLCVRSLAYVFARVSCAREAEGYVTLGDTGPEEAMPRGVIRPGGAKLALPMGPGESFYVARRFQPHGKAPKFALPQSGAAPFARIRNHAYTMNKFIQAEDRAPVSITATRGAEFVLWELAEGERVVFDYQYFVGMSEGVTLSSLISARFSSQIFGRLIFPTATGPGHLVLMTEGAPHIAAPGAETFSMPPSRLVAWHQNARFHIDSELGMVDIYLSEAYVEPCETSALIMDVDRQTGFGRGLARFIRQFLLPV